MNNILVAQKQKKTSEAMAAGREGRRLKFQRRIKNSV